MGEGERDGRQADRPRGEAAIVVCMYVCMYVCMCQQSIVVGFIKRINEGEIIGMRHVLTEIT